MDDLTCSRGLTGSGTGAGATRSVRDINPSPTGTGADPSAGAVAQRCQRRDLPDELRPHRPGQVVAHAGEPHEAGVRDRLGDREASARRDQRVMEPVDDQCRDGDPAQRRSAVRLARARRELPPVADRVVPAVPASARQVTYVLLVEREAVRADEPERLDGRSNGRGPVAGHAPPQQPGVNPGFRAGPPGGTRWRSSSA